MGSLRIDRVQLEIIIGNDEARLRMKELEADTRRLKRELKKLPKESEAYIQKSAELKKVQTEYDAIIEKIGLTGLTTKELTRRQRELNSTLANLSPDHESYEQYEQQLKAVNKRLAELKAKTRATAAAQTTLRQKIGKVADGFNRYFGLIAGITASLAGLMFSFRQTIQKFNDFEESLDGLSSITGLTGEKLQWLGEQAKDMSVEITEDGIRITKSAIEIDEAFAKVGSKRPELLAVKEDLAGVTKDAIILSQAARGTLDPSVNALTNSLNQFSESADQSRRFINAIAAGSKAGAGNISYISTAVEKAGTIANDANISFEGLIGMIETTLHSVVRCFE